MVGHASAEDTRVLGGSGGIPPRKYFEIPGPQTAGNALERSILLHHIILYHFKSLYYHRRTFLTPGGGGVRVHPAHPSAYRTALSKNIYIHDISSSDLRPKPSHLRQTDPVWDHSLPIFTRNFPSRDVKSSLLLGTGMITCQDELIPTPPPQIATRKLPGAEISSSRDGFLSGQKHSCERALEAIKILASTLVAQVLYSPRAVSPSNIEFKIYRNTCNEETKVRHVSIAYFTFACTVYVYVPFTLMRI